MKVLLIETNFFQALNLKKSIIAKYPNINEADIVWVNSVDSANLMFQNNNIVFDSIVVDGKPASSQVLESLGLSSMIILERTENNKSRSGVSRSGLKDAGVGSNNVNSCLKKKERESDLAEMGLPNAQNMQNLPPGISHNCVPLLREVDRLDNQISELKAYAHRTTDNLFDEVEKIETILYNATGGGLVTRIEKLTFSVTEIHEKVEELNKSLKQLEDFRYNISTVVSSLKEKQDTSLFQKSKAWELTIMGIITIGASVVTFALGQFSAPQSQPSRQSEASTKHAVSFVRVDTMHFQNA